MKELIKNKTWLRRAYYRLQMIRAKGQSDENELIESLSANAPQTFVEFGFHPIEFNCAALVRNNNWQGLLIDGNRRQVEDARSLFPDRIKVVEAFLNLNNLDFIKTTFPQIGVLSIDVDGNDFWFLKALIETNPALICIEYNSSFGQEAVTIPYDPLFDRHHAHPRGWYHGASLSALCKLAKLYEYGLAAVSKAGANAFFTKSGCLDPGKAWRPNLFRAQFSGASHEEQWNSVKEMPFVSI